MALDLRAINSTVPPDPVGKGHSAAASVREPQDAALGDPAASPSRAIREHQIALWVKRGEEFIAVGDFVSARLMFQRAAEKGSAKAAFMLAETYDPAALDTIRAMGVAPDIAKARLWYEKAKNSRVTRSGAKARSSQSGRKRCGCFRHKRPYIKFRQGGVGRRVE